MPRLTQIYTRTGDQGETSLLSGPRVPKDSRRVSALGSVDELNANLGLAVSLGLEPGLAALVEEIQHSLIRLGGDLATPGVDPTSPLVTRVNANEVQMLESVIDGLTAQLGPLADFILPAGTAAAAQLHIARTVCRRAEREVVAVARSEAIGAFVLPYLNRLSDALFLMARQENDTHGRGETLA